MSDLVKADAELLPSLDLPDLPAALGALRDELATLPDLEKQALAITCTYPATPPEDYRKLVELVDQMQDVGKAGEEQMRPLLDVVNEVADYLLAKKKNQELTAKKAWETHAERAAAWKRGEREAAAAEAKRINEERQRKANEEAEAKRKADEKTAIERRKARVNEIRGMLRRKEISKSKAAELLTLAGATEEAEKARAAANAEQLKKNVQTVTVTPNVPKVSGRRGTIKYSAEVENTDTLLMAYVATFMPEKGRVLTWQEQATQAERRAYLRRFIMANEQALGEEAREVKDSAKLNATIPGVKFTDKDTV